MSDDHPLEIRLGSLCVSAIGEYLPELKHYADRSEVGKKHRLGMTVELALLPNGQYAAHFKVKRPAYPTDHPESVLMMLEDQGGQLGLFRPGPAQIATEPTVAAPPPRPPLPPRRRALEPMAAEPLTHPDGTPAGRGVGAQAPYIPQDNAQVADSEGGEVPQGGHVRPNGDAR